MDKATGLEMEQVVEPMPLLEWFTEKYKEFGAHLEFVTNKSQEGSQFVKGFGGIGGILRYKVAFEELGDNDEDDDEFYNSDDDSGMSPFSFSGPGQTLTIRHLKMPKGRNRPAQLHARWRPSRAKPRVGRSVGGGRRIGGRSGSGP
jgi:hypothetical protein